MASDCPVRSYMDDPGIQWRDSKPDYTVINAKYLAERAKHHPADSLEKVVENLVKTWEMEASHKKRAEDWCTVDKDVYYISSNGGRRFNIDEGIERGTYNVLMAECPLYQAHLETYESSHKLFRQSMPGGFAWEVLEVFSGPPKVSFTWRHWGTWEGRYKASDPTGETLEMTGSCVVLVNDDLKIQSIDVYFDPNPMMAKMLKFTLNGCPVQRDQ